MAKSTAALAFTRFLWVPVLGAAIGATLLFELAPVQYTARIPFAVLPPSPPIGVTEEVSQVLTQDDTTQILHRQELIFQQEKFLTDVMASSEFHTRSDGMPGDCAWLKANRRNPMPAIKRDLKVVPRPSAASFEVTMTTRNAVESFNLVEAASKVYLQRLQADSANRRTAFLRNLGDAVKQAENNLQIKSDALADYQKRHGIDVLKSQFEITKNALQNLNDQYTRDDTAASCAEQQYEALKRTQADGKEVELAADLQEKVDEDATLRMLISTRYTLQQDKAALEASGAPVAPRLKETDARLAKIDEQIVEWRKMLTGQARARMEKALLDDATSKRFLAKYIGGVRAQKQDIVTGIGQDLLVWQQRVDDLREQSDLVAKIRSQMNLAQANQATDDTRVHQIDDATIPIEPDGPAWEIPTSGAGLGFVLGLIPACLLAWGYKKRATVASAAPAAAPPPLPPT